LSLRMKTKALVRVSTNHIPLHFETSENPVSLRRMQ
jgi:hypothetical protein